MGIVHEAIEIAAGAGDDTLTGQSISQGFRATPTQRLAYGRAPGHQGFLESLPPEMSVAEILDGMDE